MGSEKHVTCKGRDFYKTPEGLTLLEGWARAGLTMNQIAHNVGRTTDCIYKWIKDCPEIAEAIKKGREVVDLEVERALYKSALGYTVEEEQSDNKGYKRRVTRYIPASVSAQIFWLKNRKSKEWKDRTEQAVTGAVPVVIKDDL